LPAPHETLVERLARNTEDGRRRALIAIGSPQGFAEQSFLGLFKAWKLIGKAIHERSPSRSRSPSRLDPERRFYFAVQPVLVLLPVSLT
jgi:hypothetical protein